MTRKHKLAAGAAALVTAAGAGGAVAATHSQTNRQRAFVDDAAARLHVAPTALRSALTQAYLDRLDAAVKAGRLTPTEAARIRQRIEQRGAMPWLHLSGGHHHRRLLVRAAAEYLGLTPEALRTELRSGHSLADVAKAQNKSVDGLRAALIQALQTRIKRAASTGAISQARAREIEAKLPARLDRLINRRWGS